MRIAVDKITDDASEGALFMGRTIMTSRLFWSRERLLGLVVEFRYPIAPEWLQSIRKLCGICYRAEFPKNLKINELEYSTGSGRVPTRHLVDSLSVEPRTNVFHRPAVPVAIVLDGHVAKVGMMTVFGMFRSG